MHNINLKRFRMLKLKRNYRREEQNKAEGKHKKRKRRRRRGGVKSSELDKETCGILVKGTCVSGVRQSAVERLPK